MAGPAEILREYLVRLGFAVDESSVGRFNDAVERTSKAVGEMARVVEAAGTVLIGAAFERMAAGMSQLHFQAQRAGATVQGFKEFGYAMEQIGGSAERAQQSLNNFGRFLQSSPNAIGAVKQLGIDILDGAGKAKNAAQLLEEVLPALAKRPLYQALQYGAVFGINPDDIIAVHQNLERFTAALPEYRQKLQQVGVNQEKAHDSAANLELAWRRLVSVLGLVRDKLVLALGPTLTENMDRLMKLITEHSQQISDTISYMARGVSDSFGLIGKGITEAGRLFSELPTNIQHVIEALGAALVAWRLLSLGFMATPAGMVIGGLLTILGVLKDYKDYRDTGKSLLPWDKLLPNIEPYVRPIIEWFQKLPEPLRLAAEAVGLFTAATLAFSLSPIGATIAALGLLLATFQDYLRFKATGQSLIDWGKLLPTIDSYITPIVDGFKYLWALLKQIDLTPMTEAFEQLGPQIKEAFGEISAFSRDHWDTIKAITRGAADYIVKEVASLVRIIGDKISLVGHLITGQWAAAWDDAKKLFSDTWDFIIGNIPGVGEALERLGLQIKESLQPITDALGYLWTRLQQLGTQLWEAFEPMRSALVSIVEFFRDHWDTIKQIVKGTTDYVILLVADMIRLLADTLGLLGNLITSNWAAAWNDATLLFLDAWNIILDAIPGVGPSLKGAIEDVRRFGADVIHLLADTLGLLGNLLAGNWAAAWKDAKLLFLDAWNIILDAIPAVGPSLKRAIEDGRRAGWGAFWSDLKEDTLSGLRVIGDGFVALLGEDSSIVRFVRFLGNTLGHALRLIVDLLMGDWKNAWLDTKQLFADVFGIFDAAIESLRQHAPKIAERLFGASAQQLNEAGAVAVGQEPGPQGRGGFAPNEQQPQVGFESVTNELMAGGYTEAQAVGMTAGLVQESGLRPYVKNPKSGAYGIFQTLNPRNEAAIFDHFKKSIFDMNAREQLAAMLWLLSPAGPEAAVGAQLREAGLSVEEVARRFVELFERPGPQDRGPEAAKAAGLARSQYMRRAGHGEEPDVLQRPLPAPGTVRPSSAAAPQLPPAAALSTGPAGPRMTRIPDVNQFFAVAQPTQPSTSNDNRINVNQQNTFNVSGAHSPESVADQVLRGQRRLNADLTRNLIGAVR